tara:strand:- start:199 stop:363 length:165 start_codon:yes stop_codon:yes gene_type:complete
MIGIEIAFGKRILNGIEGCGADGMSLRFHPQSEVFAWHYPMGLLEDWDLWHASV